MSSLPRKIDVHHHIVPQELAGVGDGLRGMKPPPWDFTTDTAFCASLGISTRIFSVTTPGVLYIADINQSAATARSINEHCAALRDKNPQSVGFFATIPSLEHTELALAEIRFALDELHADGVTLFTSYSARDVYLGHEKFVPIWRELDKRKAVAFVHPKDNGHEPTMFHEKLPGPSFDWPHETGRTAMDLILHRRLLQFPNVKIILSHAGGTLPLLATRVQMIALPQFGAFMTAKEIQDQAKSFYFDCALSGSPEVWPMILGFAKKDHLLFGSDYPHAPEPLGRAHTEFIDGYEISEEKRREVYFGAAEVLFPRLRI